MTDLVWDDAGVERGGPTLVLVHAAVAGRRMWEPLLPTLTERHRVVAYDVRGFGASPAPTGDFYDHDDLLAVMDAAGVDRAVVVGASNGGRIAADLAAVAPERVSGLVLLGAALPGLGPGVDPELTASDDEQERLLAAGDLDGATAIDVDLWLVGSGRRREDLPEPLRSTATGWFRAELQRVIDGTWSHGEAQEIDPPLRDRLGDIRVPTLVVVGVHDLERIQVAAQRYAHHLPDARLQVVEGAAHLVGVEQPDRVAQLILDHAGTVAA